MHNSHCSLNNFTTQQFHVLGFWWMIPMVPVYRGIQRRFLRWSSWLCLENCRGKPLGTQVPTWTWPAVKTRSPQVLLGGPGGQGTRVEVSPDTSRAWATRRVNPGVYRQSPEHGKVVWSLQSISGARTNSQRLGIVQGVLVSSPGWTWLLPLVQVQDLLRAGRGPKGIDRVRPENRMD